MSPTEAEEDESQTDEVSAETDASPDGEAADGEELEAEELSEQDKLDLKRLDIALTTLDDESLRHGLGGVTEKQRQELAVALNLPRATMHLGDALAPLVRRKLRGLTVDRQHAVSTALTQRTNDTTVELLGENSEDPSRADLDAVLPAVIEEHGVELVRLMAASYSISDAPCRDVMRELLETDERLALPEAADDASPATALPNFGLVARPVGKAKNDPERAELLERRKAAKAERRAAAVRARAARAQAQASRREALHASKHPPTSH
jgi:hypothetical protein